MYHLYHMYLSISRGILLSMHFLTLFLLFPDFICILLFHDCLAFYSYMMFVYFTIPWFPCILVFRWLSYILLSYTFLYYSLISLYSSIRWLSYILLSYTFLYYSLIFLYTLFTILIGSGRGIGVNICIMSLHLSYHFINKLHAFLNSPMLRRYFVF